MSNFTLTKVSEPPDVGSDNDEEQMESQLNSPGNLRRDSVTPPRTVPTDRDSALESADLLSHVESTSTLSSISENAHSLVTSLIVEPISNVVINPTTAPRLGNLWNSLKSVRIRTLLYSSMVTVMASLSFGYGIGFSSPTLHDLNQNEGKHTFFNKNVYHSLFNVSNTKFIICNMCSKGLFLFNSKFNSHAI